MQVSVLIVLVWNTELIVKKVVRRKLRSSMVQERRDNFLPLEEYTFHQLELGRTMDPENMFHDDVYLK